MQVFARVVEAGSFAKAAERLGLSTSATSRQVAELEAQLQTRLLNRTTRRVSLPESGRAFYERSLRRRARRTRERPLALEQRRSARRGGRARRRHRLRAGLHRRSRGARRTSRAAASGIRAAARADLRALPEPQASLGQGAALRRVS